MERKRDENFGPRVRAIRQRLGLTLQELGRRSGIAFSTISKVEKGLVSPTYESILRLADGLNVDLSELFSDHATSMTLARRSISYAGTGVLQKTPGYTFEMLNTDLKEKKFIPIYATIKPAIDGEAPALIQHRGEELIYVLDGAVDLHTTHYEVVRLQKGDCCYFDSQLGHACVAVGDTEAHVLWICSSLEAAQAFQTRNLANGTTTGTRRPNANGDAAIITSEPGVSQS